MSSRSRPRADRVSDDRHHHDGDAMSAVEVNVAEFTRTGEVEVDSRRRVSLGRVDAVQEHPRYFVSTAADGRILLVPARSIPAREAVIWENEAIRASLIRGME